MAEFYIEKVAQTNGEHIVHKATCSQLPDKAIIHYLGSLSSSKIAISTASHNFRNIVTCSHCIAA